MQAPEPLRLLQVGDGASLGEGPLDLHGFRLELASTAVRVLELVRSDRFDLVLIDADLDGLDGSQLSRALRSEGFLGAVVLLAAAPTPRDHDAALSAGANDFLDKATPHELLVERLRAHVIGSRVKAAGVRFPITVDVPSEAGVLTMLLTPTFVALGGEPLPLTRIEERLLGRLWAGRGAVISWEELTASTWMGRRVAPQALRVHLSQLRRKLRNLGLVIEHVRGEGDRFFLTSHRTSEEALEGDTLRSVKKT